jgi:hypothetical protein
MGAPVAAPATADRFKSSSTRVMLEQAKHATYWRTLWLKLLPGRPVQLQEPRLRL